MLRALGSVRRNEGRSLFGSIDNMPNPIINVASAEKDKGRNADSGLECDRAPEQDPDLLLLLAIHDICNNLLTLVYILFISKYIINHHASQIRYQRASHYFGTLFPSFQRANALRLRSNRK